MARLAIAKGFLGEYAKLDKDVRPTAEPAGQNPQLPFAAWRTFLVLDADVRHRIEVLNVDRLAYHVVKQAAARPSSRTSGCCATAGPRQSRRPGWPHPGVRQLASAAVSLSRDPRVLPRPSWRSTWPGGSSPGRCPGAAGQLRHAPPA